MKKARKQESKKSIGGAQSASHTLDDLETRFPHQVAEALLDWLSYKQERHEGYKPTGLKSLMTQVENNVQQFGPQPVEDVIRLSMSNGWRGIIWDRIESKASKTTGGFADLAGDW